MPYLKKIGQCAIGAGLILWLAGCAVMPRATVDEALKDIEFDRLMQTADHHRGRTVILGGHILATTVMENETQLTVLQTPLSIGQEPQPKDRSQGRFMVYFKGFLEPEVYRKDRRITVAGTILGAAQHQLDGTTYRYLEISSSKIHLWTYTEDDYRRPPVYPYPPHYPFGWYWPYDYHYRYHRYR
jgi:outer membrane lipoprotein